MRSDQFFLRRHLLPAILAQALLSQEIMGFTRTSCLMVVVICLYSPLRSFANNVTFESAKGWRGEEAALTCRVTGSPTQVVLTMGVTTPIGTWNTESGVSLSDESGKYDISIIDTPTDTLKEFSLLVKNISLSDNGTYGCTAQYGEGNLKVNLTTLTVYVEPEGPMIEECIQDSDGDEGDRCRFELDNATSVVNVTCKVSHFYPRGAVQVAWTVGGQMLQPIWQSWHNNTDGTTCGHVAISATPNSDPYVCTATGPALRGTSDGGKRVQASVEQTEVIPSSTTPPPPEGEEEEGCLDLWVIIVIAAAVGGVVLITLVTLVYCRCKKPGIYCCCTKPGICCCCKKPGICCCCKKPGIYCCCKKPGIYCRCKKPRNEPESHRGVQYQAADDTVEEVS